MNELPQGWKSVTVADVGLITTGNTPSTKIASYFGGRTPFVKPSDLDQPTPIVQTAQTLSDDGVSQARLLRSGAVLISCIGNLGKVGIAGVPVVTNQQINAVEFDPTLVHDRYGFQYCRTLKPWMEQEASATTITILNKGRFSTAPFPLAPLNEQQRIADKLDTVLARVDACREHLDRVPAILKRFRQAVLAAATSGTLTEDWRAQKKVVSSAEAEVQKREAEGKSHLRVRAAGPMLGNLDLYELPDSWGWIKNHRLAVDSTSAICAGPFGTIFKAKDFRTDGVPIIFLRHVAEGRYLTTKPGFMDEGVWRELHQPYSVFGGELLVTKLGDPPGTACIYPKGIGKAMVTPDVMKMKVDEKVAAAEYLMYFFISTGCKKLIEQLAFGVTRLRIDLSMEPLAKCSKCEEESVEP